MTQAHDLRRLSLAAGSALLSVCALQLLLSFLLPARFLRGGEILPYCFVLLLGGLPAHLPGVLLGRGLLPPGERKRALPFGKPRNQPAAVVLAGVALCYWGNLASAFVGALGRRAGVEFQGPPDIPAKTPGQLLLLLLATAVLPAVVEELLLRGVVMQPLRRYGRGFAVVCSAALFALLHGNLRQAPMAFVSGLALGYAALRCESLRVPMAIHLWNNAASVALQYLQETVSAGAFGMVSRGYMIAVTVLGVIGVGVLLSRRRVYAKPLIELRPLRRAVNYFFGSVPMVLAVASLLIVIIRGVG